MPQISSRELLRIQRATTDVAQEPLLTLLLPCLSRQPKCLRRDAPIGLDYRHKGPFLSTAAVEGLFISALYQAGSSNVRHSADGRRNRFGHERVCASYKGGQRHWFSSSQVVNHRVADHATIVKPPANQTTPSSSAKSVAATIQPEDQSDGRTVGTSSPLESCYELVDHGENPSSRNPGVINLRKLEDNAQLLLELKASEGIKNGTESDSGSDAGQRQSIGTDGANEGWSTGVTEQAEQGADQILMEQIRYLRTVRELEAKLGKARGNLHMALNKGNERRKAAYWERETYQDQEGIELMHLSEAEMTPLSRPPVKLKKEDFLDLVDLYFYSHQARFLSESPDSSPTPLQLSDYSFQISEDFSPPANPDPDRVRDEEGTPMSPLYHIEAEIKCRKLEEIQAFQRFVDLLLDDYSALHELFGAYKELPHPGVAYLSSGVIRLFLQRMSTPWRRSEKAMLRYLSLLDDMQRVGLPITAWEWSSAIHLAGNSFHSVSNADVAAAFRMWRQMEKEAGVAARDVTFNILFNIAVKAEKFVLAEEILKEMHDRGFRLNRLGRVSLIHYYGRKRDGDGVRKAYRDFVEAGEIVDTLVLNCVMASLIAAQEPAAAEQTYERIKGLQQRFQKRIKADGEEALFVKYPPPGPDKFGVKAASNALGRVLLNASRVKTILPEHHAALQNIMPLTPNAVTFRTLMTHHAKTSGNIDRLTVLLDDMTRTFGIPVSHLTFQLLFTGFAMHGGSARSDLKWSRQRLQITWAACLVCMKAKRSKNAESNEKAASLSLPSVKEVETLAVKGERQTKDEASQRRKPPTPTAWDSFIRQFASPYPQTKPFETYPSTPDASESLAETVPNCDEEYQLPVVGLTPGTSAREEMSELKAIQPSKHLATWIIRSFARCTANRQVLEDVWYQLSRVWRPAAPEDKAVVVRELRRALRYCDTHGGNR